MQVSERRQQEEPPLVVFPLPDDWHLSDRLELRRVEVSPPLPRLKTEFLTLNLRRSRYPRSTIVSKSVDHEGISPRAGRAISSFGIRVTSDWDEEGGPRCVVHSVNFAAGILPAIPAVQVYNFNAHVYYQRMVVRLLDKWALRQKAV